MQLPLQIFEDELHNRIRTVTLNGEPWFYALDVCKALGIANSWDAVARLDQDDVGTADGVDTLNRRATFSIVNESGLYNLVFESHKDGAKRFKRWITSEVIPQLRKTGSFHVGTGKGTPIFIRRFNDNWELTDPGYFSVIGELAIRLFGRLEMLG